MGILWEDMGDVPREVVQTVMDAQGFAAVEAKVQTEVTRREDLGQVPGLGKAYADGLSQICQRAVINNPRGL